MKGKNIFIFITMIIIIGIIIFFIFFNMDTSKNLKIGNNNSSQEIIDYILNINSYETRIEVKVNSSKNVNKYIIKQEYKSPNKSVQEVIEPSNIAGVKIIRDDKQLKIENTDLNLTSIFENYEYVSDNSLDLSNFIEDYKSDEKATWKEEDNHIIMITNKNGKDKMLYISKETNKPIKLVIKDINKKNEVYISYNEINIK